MSDTTNDTKLSALEAEINKLNAQAEQVKGSRCEVFARVCGYYRSTESWNDGKKEECRERLPFDVSSDDFKPKLQDLLPGC